MKIQEYKQKIEKEHPFLKWRLRFDILHQIQKLLERLKTK